MSVSHRWRAPCSHNVLLALSVMMSHQTHFAVISVMIMICLFFQRLSIWLPGFRTSNWAHKRGHRPPIHPHPTPIHPNHSVSLLLFHSLSWGFTFLIKKKCHGHLVNAIPLQAYYFWLFLLLYYKTPRTFAVSRTSNSLCAVHRMVKMKSVIRKELRRFDAFACNISPSLKHIMQKKYIKWRQAPKRTLISLIGW